MRASFGRLFAFFGNMDSVNDKDFRGEATQEFQELEAHDSIDRFEVIAEGMKTFTWWCLRLLVIAATSWVTWYVMSKFWRGLLPIFIALILSSVLWTPTGWMQRRGVPPALSAIITILGTLAFFGGLIGLIAPSIVNQSQTLFFQAFEGVQRLQLWLQGPPLHINSEDLNGWFSDAATWLQQQSGTIAGELFAGLGVASSVLVTIGIVLVLTFFFLKDGPRFMPWLREVTGRRVGWHLTELFTRAWITLAGFIRAQALVSFVDAVFIGLGLALLGVPMALALGTLTFIAGFIPIVGAVVAGALAVMIAFVSHGTTTAFLVLGLVILVQQLEGNILQPMVQSRAMNLHPVVILISVTLGGSLFGIIGAFLAVPTAAMLAVLLRYLSDLIALRSGEKRAADIEFATLVGSLTAQEGEEAGRKMRAARREDTATPSLSRLQDILHVFRS